jgi:hypothetical protein
MYAQTFWYGSFTSQKGGSAHKYVLLKAKQKAKQNDHKKS